MVQVLNSIPYLLICYLQRAIADDMKNHRYCIRIVILGELLKNQETGENQKDFNRNK
jgi:hypothetical protein